MADSLPILTVTTKQAQSLLNCSRNQIAHLVKQGKLNPLLDIKLSSRVFAMEEILSLTKPQKKKTKSTDTKDSNK